MWAHLRHMSVLWRAVEDAVGPASDRAYLERYAIAQLAGGDAPSQGWVGNHSGRHEIGTSGLWNLNHAGRSPAPGFIEAFERYVEMTVAAYTGIVVLEQRVAAAKL